MNEELISSIVKSVIETLNCNADSGIPVEASARHVHLSQADVEALFGAGHTLTHKRDLSQPGQFLCEERVRLIGSKGVFENVAVLGPARNDTQIELSYTDCLTVGISAPLRESGDIADSGRCCISNKDKFIMAEQGVIVAKRHIHMTPADAERLGVIDSQLVSVRVGTERPVVFEDVVIRCRESFALAMHIDFDEANACMLKAGATAEILTQ